MYKKNDVAKVEGSNSLLYKRKEIFYGFPCLGGCNAQETAYFTGNVTMQRQSSLHKPFIPFPSMSL